MINKFDLEKIGEEMYELIRELYPINRSITGDGVRKTLKILQKKIQTINNSTQKFKKTFLNENFQLLPFNKNHTPLFFIAVGCKKET